jgi:hypothetical protein
MGLLMKVFSLLTFWRVLVVASACLVTPLYGANTASHSGPVIAAYVQRGAERLPIFKVDHLRVGDRLSVTTDRSGTAQGAWVLILAVASPSGNQVSTRKFDLTSASADASIDITADDQVPIIVIAPQVKTMFGLSTSFDQSASMLADAITSDPQRFVELQKIEQINLAIASLQVGLDALVVKLKAEEAVDSAKTLAGKFGVKNVEAECFKNGAVDTRCVATSIVSSRDLKLPSIVELGSMAQPFATATLPADILANVRLVAAASTFLANKYRDQYDIAPAFGQRERDSERLQLFASARFLSGDVKTAYVYVPSWFAGKQAQWSFSAKQVVCMAGGELMVQANGPLPLANYWHSWRLSLHAMGSTNALAQIDTVNFSPEKGVAGFDVSQFSANVREHPQPLEARLTGKYGFTPVAVGPVAVAFPLAGSLQGQLLGQDSLVSGEKAIFHFADNRAGICAERMTLVAAKTELAATRVTGVGPMELDLKSAPAGPAMLELLQTGGSKLVLPVRILPRRASVTRVERYELESDFLVFGENLDRIESLRVGALTCVASSAAHAPTLAGARNFSCPLDASIYAGELAKITVVHAAQEPPPFDAVVTNLSARPHMEVVNRKNSPVALLSSKAIQWGLALNDALVTEDSGLALSLRTARGYKLGRGTYTLQIKFGDEAPDAAAPIAAPLMVDLARNELRTRSPINFQSATLPAIVNAIWFRVVHQPSGLAGDWLPLNKSVVSLPSLGSVACGAGGKGWVISGSQLDMVEWASSDLARSQVDPNANAADVATLARCDKGLCLGIDKLGSGQRLKVKVHWIDDRLFDVSLSDPPTCAAAN